MRFVLCVERAFCGVFFGGKRHMRTRDTFVRVLSVSCLSGSYGRVVWVRQRAGACVRARALLPRSRKIAQQKYMLGNARTDVAQMEK